MLLIVNSPSGDLQWDLILRALLIGIQFDNLIASYVTALPLVFLLIFILVVAKKSQFPQWICIAIKIVTWFYGVVYTFGLTVAVANVRYYGFFDNHLNIAVTEWFAFVGDTAGLIFGDFTNWIFIIIGLGFITLFWWALFATSKFHRKRLSYDKCILSSNKDVFLAVTIIIFSWGLCFCGIRGSFQRYPLSVSFAYFCDNPFYNKLGVNPIFNIIKSAEYSQGDMPKVLQNVPIDEALDFVRNELQITEYDSLCPIVRTVLPDTIFEKKKNLVIILMEGMAACHLDKTYEGRPVLPYLNSLKQSVFYFPKFYSAGVHTNGGITATLYGYVPNFSKATMTVPTQLYTGLPYWLKKANYNTLFFCTGNPQYDNMNSFLRDNGFDRLYSLYDYPPSAAVNNYGVPDDFMFTFALDKLEQASRAEQPFFATLLTVSNHLPYVVQEPFDTMFDGDQQLQILAYADYALSQFMTNALATDWAENTIFVLLGDHGTPYGEMHYNYTYDYNHIAAFIVEPEAQPDTFRTAASQIDLFPMLMGKMQLPYENNTLGVDLLREKRKYAFFVNNDQCACTDGEWLYAYSINSGKENLHRLGNTDELISAYPERATIMREYVLNMMKINFYAKQHNWTLPHHYNKE